MTTDPILFPNRFINPSRYYTTGRPLYPQLLSRRVAALVGVSRNDAVLDLGTGPGFLAIDFAPLAKSVTAIDPSDEMLQAARENAERAHVKVSFVKGSSFELSPQLGRFKLVTIGRAFHWMDGDQTLAALAGFASSIERCRLAPLEMEARVRVKTTSPVKFDH
jgi:SAM-dependent methyltransferase